MTVRVRFAPSPTGHLHIGGVRTALFNYLFAKHHKGELIIRFEDTDLERNVPGAEEEMLKGFRWLGFEWDEGPDAGGAYGPYRCTERLDIYRSYLEQLIREGIAYPCFCSPEELEAEREQHQTTGDVWRYSGKCRHLTQAERDEKIAAGMVPNWRFAVESGIELSFFDHVRGQVTFQSDDVGDFVIVKSNGIPVYNFQVVIDDALMKITHIIRGEEHLSNTPRQLLVYRALGFEAPTFAHLSQVLDQTRKKLSKRDPNVMPVHVYREKGYLPEALVNFLALLGWSPGGEDEILSMAQLQEKFDLDRVNRSGAVFDVDKLEWMSQQYLKRLPVEELLQMVQYQLKRHNIALPEGKDEGWLQSVVTLYRDHMSHAEQFIGLANHFFQPMPTWDEEAVALLRDPGAVDVVSLYRNLVDEMPEWTPEESKARFKRVQTILGVKGKNLFMPVRAAITGAVHGPDLQQSIACLPKAWVISRLEEAVHIANQ